MVKLVLFALGLWGLAGGAQRGYSPAAPRPTATATPATPWYDYLVDVADVFEEEEDFLMSIMALEIAENSSELICEGRHCTLSLYAPPDVSEAVGVTYLLAVDFQDVGGDWVSDNDTFDLMVYTDEDCELWQIVLPSYLDDEAVLDALGEAEVGPCP